MIRGVAGQSIGAQMVSAATGAAFAGAVTVYVTKDRGIQAIGSVGGGACTLEGNGYYTYAPSADETDGDLLAFTFTGAGAVPVTIQVATITAAQVSALQTATGLNSVLAQVVITDALKELRVVRSGDSVEPDLLDDGLGKLNRLLDRWNANPRARYAVGFSSYTLTTNHQPHTIGPNSADFTVAMRPVRIKGANLILTSVSPAVRVPLNIRDDAWWLGLPVPTIATPFPTDLYYSPGWPNGEINLYPVPTQANDLELLTDSLFGSVTLQDTFWMPYGYRDAITLTLAEEMADMCGQTASRRLTLSAEDARSVIFGNNDDNPRIDTCDSGLGRGGAAAATWDYRSRSSR